MACLHDAHGEEEVFSVPCDTRAWLVSVPVHGTDPMNQCYDISHFTSPTVSCPSFTFFPECSCLKTFEQFLLWYQVGFKIVYLPLLWGVLPWASESTVWPSLQSWPQASSSGPLLSSKHVCQSSSSSWQSSYSLSSSSLLAPYQVKDVQSSLCRISASATTEFSNSAVIAPQGLRLLFWWNNRNHISSEACNNCTFFTLLVKTLRGGYLWRTEDKNMKKRKGDRWRR